MFAGIRTSLVSTIRSQVFNQGVQFVGNFSLMNWVARLSEISLPSSESVTDGACLDLADSDRKFLNRFEGFGEAKDSCVLILAANEAFGM